MGFFSGSKTTVPATGFYATLPEYQDLYREILGQAGGVAGGALNTQAFTPLAKTAQEQRAFGQIDQGLGTPETFQKNLNLVQNPFDQFVINDINRESQGANSLVNQAGIQAGQMGSNRNFLQTSDVEQQRLNEIGRFRQDQYNTSVNNALGPLANLQQQDITNLLGAGGFDRGLDASTKQAPYTALAANQGALAGFPTEFGNFGSEAFTVKSGGGLGGVLGGIKSLGGLASGGSSALGALGLPGAQTLGTIGKVAEFFSDRRLKEDIELLGKENGHNVYKFRYIGDDKKYIGVMADEVEHVSGAVVEIEGYKAVNYDMIGVTFREVA